MPSAPGDPAPTSDPTLDDLGDPPDPPTEPGSRVDGRLLRSRRTRAAVVDALLTLNRAGDLAPTAPRIATQAGVSLRTVWQHFEDMETLYAEAGVQFAAQVGAMVTPVDTALPLAERVRAFTAQRAQVLEAISPVAAAARLKEPFSPALQENRTVMHARSRAESERVFAAELDVLPADLRAELVGALVAVSGSSCWSTLREDLRLDPVAAEAVLHRTVLSLLTAPVQD